MVVPFTLLPTEPAPGVGEALRTAAAAAVVVKAAFRVLNGGGFGREASPFEPNKLAREGDGEGLLVREEEIGVVAGCDEAEVNEARFEVEDDEGANASSCAEGTSKLEVPASGVSRFCAASSASFFRFSSASFRCWSSCSIKDKRIASMIMSYVCWLTKLSWVDQLVRLTSSRS